MTNLNRKTKEFARPTKFSFTRNGFSRSGIGFATPTKIQFRPKTEFHPGKLDSAPLIQHIGALLGRDSIVYRVPLHLFSNYMRWRPSQWMLWQPRPRPYY